MLSIVTIETKKASHEEILVDISEKFIIWTSKQEEHGFQEGGLNGTLRIRKEKSLCNKKLTTELNKRDINMTH